MKYSIYIIIFISITLYGFTKHQNILAREKDSMMIVNSAPEVLAGDISDFFSGNKNLDIVASRRVDALSNKELAGMVLMPAYEKHHNHGDLKKWLLDYDVGGFMVLTPDYDLVDINFVNTVYDKNLPLLISIDAEPSLVKYRLPSLKNIPDTDSLDSVYDSADVAKTISNYIHNMGVNINFSPVYDGNQNKTVIGNRSYGNDAETIHELARAFSSKSMKQGIVPTAKHFPGHGNVTGDTHKNLQTIDGDLVELDQFKLAIEDGIPIVMVGHLAIKNNQQWGTNGLPASLSDKIITGLLKDELGFKGLVITDALNMGALDPFGDTSIMALEAGADIVLLPRNIDEAFAGVHGRIKEDAEFKKIIQEKAQKIIKLKLVLYNLDKNKI